MQFHNPFPINWNASTFRSKPKIFSSFTVSCCRKYLIPLWLLHYQADMTVLKFCLLAIALMAFCLIYWPAEWSAAHTVFVFVLYLARSLQSCPKGHHTPSSYMLMEVFSRVHCSLRVHSSRAAVPRHLYYKYPRLIVSEPLKHQLYSHLSLNTP